MTKSLIPLKSEVRSIFDSFEQEFDNTLKRFDKMLMKLDDDKDEFFTIFSKRSFPKFNISETETEYVVEASVPGYKKEDLDVSVETKNNCKYIIISGKSQNTLENNKKTYKVKELHLSSFSRSILLTDNAIENKIISELKDGILKINIPKREKMTIEENKKKIEII